MGAKAHGQRHEGRAIRKSRRWMREDSAALTALCAIAAEGNARMMSALTVAMQERAQHGSVLRALSLAEPLLGDCAETAPEAVRSPASN